MHRSPFRAPALLAVPLLAALLGACSDDEAPDWLAERATSTTSAGPATTAPPATASTATTVPDPGREVAAAELAPGDCIEDAAAFTDRQVNEITSATTVACRMPHQAEVFDRSEVDGGEGDAFPGTRALRRRAQQDCRDGFEGFVGVPWTRSELEIATLWPSEASWAEGDRALVCAVFRLDGEPLEGTARGSQL